MSIQLLTWELRNAARSQLRGHRPSKEPWRGALGRAGSRSMGLLNPLLGLRACSSCQRAAPWDGRAMEMPRDLLPCKGVRRSEELGRRNEQARRAVVLHWAVPKSCPGGEGTREKSQALGPKVMPGLLSPSSPV